ncbi:uncharacterized protein LOC136024299 [Lathamus discolor]|uniref:uncharacterized protein LOC136024297 n=1 Tax=Lathamus discolor TaxID=678569 RepID=UPI0032B7AB9A
MRRCRAAALAGLAAVLLAAVGRAQMQQDPWAETSEGTGIRINCSHPNIGINVFIHWYRQLPGRGPAFLVSAHKGSKELLDPAGRLSVAADRRSSVLWLARPRRRDAAVYYCAQQARRGEPGLRPGKNRCGRGRACVSGGGGQRRPGPRGGAAAPPATGIGPVEAPPFVPQRIPRTRLRSQSPWAAARQCSSAGLGRLGQRRCSQAAEEKRFPASSFAPRTKSFPAPLLSRGSEVVF